MIELHNSETNSKWMFLKKDDFEAKLYDFGGQTDKRTRGHTDIELFM